MFQRKPREGRLPEGGQAPLEVAQASTDLGCFRARWARAGHAAGPAHVREEERITLSCGPASVLLTKQEGRGCSVADPAWCGLPLGSPELLLCVPGPH